MGEDNCVTYKGPKVDASTKTRRELEIQIESGDKGAAAFRELLQALGFKHVADVRKTRHPMEVVWQDRPVDVCLDELEGLGLFLELEIVANESQMEEAKSTIASLAQELGLTESIRESYLEMLLRMKLEDNE